METMTSQYVYTLEPAGGSSDRYGPCEVCGKHATEVFLQQELQHLCGLLTTYLCRPAYVGHRDCLTKIRR